MTEPITTGDDGQPLSAEAAALAAEQLEQHAAGYGSPGIDPAAADTMAGAERGPALPAEADIEAFMAQVKAQMADMQAQLNIYRTQAAEAQAAAGVPLVVRYAQGAADKVTALVSAHPDAPQGHFAPLVAAAKSLAGEAEKLFDGSGELKLVQSAAADAEKFISRTHWKTWGKHIDWSAILGDLEETVEAGAKIAAAA
jgi:hypothetical protein